MHTLALLATIVLALPLAAQPRAGRAAGGAMARIPAGVYVPLYDRGDGPVRVAAFRIDRQPVTRGQFLAFVEAHPKWRRDRVRPLFADQRYLAGWAAALQPGDALDSLDARRPVTEVSWFAAAAYCRARGDRLPTVDEWEYVAAASTTERDASRDPAATRVLLASYARSHAASLPVVGTTPANVYGVRDLHGVVWEWTEDFNSVLVSDDSRGTAGRDQKLFCAAAAVGATNTTNYPAFLRHAVRAGLEGRTTMSSLGFRCAAS
ncbi:MAG: formylglycine-generating enzyme family protein [Gemmatimonadaceae bacterium]